jgi:hypothetical protein
LKIFAVPHYFQGVGILAHHFIEQEVENGTTE